MSARDDSNILESANSSLIGSTVCFPSFTFVLRVLYCHFAHGLIDSLKFVCFL